MSRRVGIAFFCVVTCAALAQNHWPTDAVWKPLPIIYSSSLPDATVPKEIAGGLQVSNLDIVLEHTEMKDAQARFGGTLGAEGDAGDSLEWLCLRGADPSGRWVLWLESGEIDGGSVGSFQWRRVTPGATFDKRCAALSPDDSTVKLPIALHLGIPETEVLRVLGTPTQRRGRTLLYVHEHQEIIKGVAFTVLNTTTVLIRDGRVWAIEVDKSTTS
jgi:hypothetical protein